MACLLSFRARPAVLTLLQVHVHDDPKKKGEPVSLYGPADIEGHKGKDGRFYLIDFARCSPPESTAVSKNQNKRAIFFQLLRPEFLRLYGKNLSCDTYSGFDPSAKHRQQLQEAVEYLHTALIPGMATKIQEKFISRDESVCIFSLPLSLSVCLSCFSKANL